MTRRLLIILLTVTLTMSAATAWALWNVGSVLGGGGAAAGSSVKQGATPTASAAGGVVTVTWAATTLTTGQAVKGYTVQRYSGSTAQTMLTACTGIISTTSCVESNVPTGVWSYAVTPLFATNWAGAESVRSATVSVDVTPPTNAITLSSISGGAYLAAVGTTVYYKGDTAGSFRLINALTDANSGPASSQTAALGGTTTGWTHTSSTASTPSGGPYLSGVFSWSAGTVSSPTELITGRDVAGTFTPTSLSFINDSTAPSAGTIAYPDGYGTGASVPVTFAAGTDGGSGIATRQLQRATALLTNGICGSFGGLTNLGPDSPVSVYTDTQMSAGVCYKYQYVVTDRVGNQHTAISTSVVRVAVYDAAVGTTTGLLSRWRLGEAASTVSSSDSFSGTTGTLLTARAGETGATWVKAAGNSSMQLTNENRVRRSTSGGSIVYTTTPLTANYSVEADLYVKSVDIDDVGGVIGRLNTGTGSFYMARWETDRTWNIVKWNGLASGLSRSTVQNPLTVGQTYRLKLEISGTTSTTLKLFVNGVQMTTIIDSSSPFTAAGQAGIMSGDTWVVAQTDSTMIQFDNFQVSPSTYPRAADSKGSNIGDYKNGPTLGVPGALAGEANTAASFDGVNDYVQVIPASPLPGGAGARSVEAWFKSSSTARQVLFSYGSRGDAQEFGLWLDAGGNTMTAWGFGSGNDKVFSMPSAVNNGQWHQVVQTYDGTSLTIYIDGVALPAQAASRATVVDAYGFGIGAVINPADSNSGGFFNGSIDEVSFYTTALDQAVVTNHYQLGKLPPADITGPTGGSVTATGLIGTSSRYAPSTTVSLSLATGTDSSGVATTGNQLQRANAPLTSGTCGTMGSYTLVAGGIDPVTPKSDTVTDQACYSYQYVVQDPLGNSTTYTTSYDIKVDLTPPAAPSLTHSGLSSSYSSSAGSVYYRSAVAGSFKTTATAADTGSGIASYQFPALGTSWTSTVGSLGVNTYSWLAAPAVPGSKSVTVTNNATGVSAPRSFTVIADDAAPSAGSVTPPDGSQTSTSVSVDFVTGTDNVGGSGIGTRLMQRRSAALIDGTCGAYGSWATTQTNPGTSPFSETVTTGSCYQYQYVVSDNVGNTDTATSTSEVKVRSGSQYSDVVGAESTLLNYYHLDEAQSSSAIGDSESANQGTYFGAPTMGQSGKVADTGNTAVQFNGSSQYGTLARQISGDFSIELWFKSSQNYGATCTSWWQGASLLDADVGGAGDDFGVSLCAGKVVAGVGSPDVSVATTGTYNNGAWHHVVFTRTQASGTMTLHVDGAQAGTATGSVRPLISQTTIHLGRSAAGNQYFAGSLDEVALYTAALPPAAVIAHYNAR